jgi:hypothetical protein
LTHTQGEATLESLTFCGSNGELLAVSIRRLACYLYFLVALTISLSAIFHVFNPSDPRRLIIGKLESTGSRKFVLEFDYGEVRVSGMETPYSYRFVDDTELEMWSFTYIGGGSPNKLKTRWTRKLMVSKDKLVFFPEGAVTPEEYRRVRP